MSGWTFEIFVDDGCSVCSREARWLAWLGRRRKRLRITGIAAAEPVLDELGITFDEAMRTIHGRWPDGRVERGVAVFRAAYAAVGLGWLLAPTRWPGVRPIADAAYKVFARRRYERRLRQGCRPAAR